MRLSVSRAVAVACAAAVGLLASGCGSTHAQTPQQALSLAAASASQKASERVTGHMHVTIHTPAASGTGATGGASLGLGGPLDVDFTADLQQTPTLLMRYSMSGLKILGTDVGKVDAILTSKAMYISLPIVTQQLGKKWLEIKFADVAKQSGLDLGSLLDQARQMDPTQYVTMLRAAGDLTKVGSETVDGVRTTHYKGNVQVAKALTLFSGDVRTQLRKSLADMGVTREHIDVWIDGDNLVRREAASADGKEMSLSLDMHVSHYGEKVDVTAPPASDTVDLGALLGSGAAG